jgi:hypothetical protein
MRCGHADRRRVFGSNRGRRGAKLRETEIENLYLSVRRDLDVAGLQIPVGDVFLVRFLKSVGDLTCDIENLVEREWPFRGFAFNHLHNEIVIPHVINLADIGMVERRDRSRFTFECLRETLCGNFDGDITAKARIARPVDLTHSAFSENPYDRIGPQRFSDIQWHWPAIVHPISVRGPDNSIASSIGSLTET